MVALSDKMAAAVRSETLRGHAYIDPEGFTLVNCANGVLRLSAGGAALRPSHPSHPFTAAVATAYRADGASPRLLEQIEQELLADERDRDLLHLTMGYSLLPDCRQQCALYCYRETGHGKSTLLDVYAEALGESLVSRIALPQLGSAKGYHVPGLAGRALNIGREVRARAQRPTLHADILREIIDGSAMEVRAIRGAPHTMHHSTKLVFSGNHLPVFVDGNEADARRWRFLHFGRRPACTWRIAGQAAIGS